MNFDLLHTNFGHQPVVDMIQLLQEECHIMKIRAHCCYFDRNFKDFDRFGTAFSDTTHLEQLRFSLCMIFAPFSYCGLNRCC